MSTICCLYLCLDFGKRETRIQVLLLSWSFSFSCCSKLACQPWPLGLGAQATRFCCTQDHSLSCFPESSSDLPVIRDASLKWILGVVQLLLFWTGTVPPLPDSSEPSGATFPKYSHSQAVMCAGVWYSCCLERHPLSSWSPFVGVHCI